MGTRILLTMLLATRLSAVIVDRIAITAGNQVITASEIELRLRLTAFENGVKPEFSTAEKKKAAERLIDQKLVEREMQVGHYPRLSPEGRKQLMDGYAEQYFRSETTAMQQGLAEYGLKLRDLEDDLARQSDLLTFLGLRFRPAVQVAEQDIRKKAEADHLPLAEFRAQIEQRLANDRADADLEMWVRDQRKRSKVEYLDKALAP